MPTRKSPRKGSLQFWPRKRAKKFLPRVNWSSIKDHHNSNKKIKGFICYKSGMLSAAVKDNTPNSMTKGKIKTIPITILVCPPMKIFSVRFYKNSRVANDVLVEKFEKELKRKVKFPKKKADVKKKIESVKAENYDDVSVVVYSQVKQTGIKKTPDLTELGLTGNVEEKMIWIKENLNKEIPINDFVEGNELIDVRGLTKGKGFSGPVKRFGIGLKSHKSEKGRRRPGSLGPWHPARVTFRVPMAGQLGMFTRVTYNSKIIKIGGSQKEDSIKNITNFGDVKTNYLIVSGSVQGPAKRQLILTHSLRPSKKQLKKNYEILELR